MFGVRGRWSVVVLSFLGDWCGDNEGFVFGYRTVEGDRGWAISCLGWVLTIPLLRLHGQEPNFSFCRIGGWKGRKWQRPFLENSLPAVFFFLCKKKQKHPGDCDFPRTPQTQSYSDTRVSWPNSCEQVDLPLCVFVDHGSVCIHSGYERYIFKKSFSCGHVPVLALYVRLPDAIIRYMTSDDFGQPIGCKRQ